MERRCAELEAIVPASSGLESVTMTTKPVTIAEKAKRSESVMCTVGADLD